MTFNYEDSTILIVDDNSANLGVLADYLEAYGFEIMTARNGESALEKVKLLPPDLILLDVMMPGINGFETCRLLKADEETKEIPVIFMTALTSEEDKVRGFDVGGVDYVTKPLHQQEVLRRITTHLSIRNLTQDLQARNEEITELNKHLEQKVAERTVELKNAYGALEQINKSKSSFIQIASHELHTPLTIIKGYTGLLKGVSTIKDDAKANDLLEQVQVGVDRMNEIVNTMLDVVRIDGDVLDVPLESMHVFNIIKMITDNLQDSFQERNITLSFVDLDTLPEIQANPDLLFKVFYHLIINAIKYTPDGNSITIIGKHPEPSEDGKSFIEIIVSDTGIGINPEHHEQIFEKFYQTGEVTFHSSGKTKFKGGGPGLGLAIVKGIVLAHHGQAWVESDGYDEETCPGSHFHIRLPIN